MRVMKAVLIAYKTMMSAMNTVRIGAMIMVFADTMVYKIVGTMEKTLQGAIYTRFVERGWWLFVVVDMENVMMIMVVVMIMVKTIFKNKVKNKAQIFSADLAIATVTFLVILVSSMWLWDYSIEKIELSERRNDLEMISKNALAVLVETPGSPSNWTELSEADFNETNIYSLGLARSYSQNNLDVARKGKSAGLSIDNYLVLDENKIQRLIALYPQKYTTYKKVLGILGPNYEFQLIIKVWNGTDYSTQYEIGSSPSQNVMDIVRADRFVLLNGEWTDVVLRLWKE